jgi:uncharacterized cofD-like protein
MAPKSLLLEMRRTAFWHSDISRTPIEHLVEFLLTGTLFPSTIPGVEDLAEQVLRFDPRHIRVLVLGGGTGMSTIVGGNSQMPDWPEQPHLGMKKDFPHLTSVVCTTDDGGSTGLLLRSFPIIGVGDIRKLLLSSIIPKNLQKKYHLGDQETNQLVHMIHGLFNHRFPKEPVSFSKVSNPLLSIPQDLRKACPKVLADSFRELGTYISPGAGRPTISPAGHSMGNLLLASAIFKAAKGRIHRSPGLREIQNGINHIASLIGVPVNRIHAATSTPGQLKFRYANGIEVYGQCKSAFARRDSPVEKVTAVFSHHPVVSIEILKAIKDADLIIYAPGSLYTSIIPVLQLEPIAAAIRANRRALKILGANSWIQEGETDISLKNQGRGFLVSELVEAYDRNISHGIRGLIDVVLSANLEHIPGNILRNYAIEGKSPIHLDRLPVEAMGVHPVEATLFSQEQQVKSQVIHHDPRRFALAIRTLLYADKYLQKKKGFNLRSTKALKLSRSGRQRRQDTRPLTHAPLPCRYMKSIEDTLSDKVFHPNRLRDFFVELAWENRDIQPSHLDFFDGVQVLPAEKWNRSTAWDNVLGYFDPKDRYLKLHHSLLCNPSRLREDSLIALGESLLGRYMEKRRWIKQNGFHCYEIVLRSPLEQKSYLTDAQLHTYLSLARMVPDAADSRIFRITINKDEGFLPPGLRFGLLYAWYLSGKGLTMEYEMALLRWPIKSLIPLHVKNSLRKESMIRFFRTEIFGHKDN